MSKAVYPVLYDNVEVNTKGITLYSYIYTNWYNLEHCPGTLIRSKQEKDLSTASDFLLLCRGYCFSFNVSGRKTSV